MFSCEFCEILKNTFFRTPPVAAFGQCLLSIIFRLPLWFFRGVVSDGRTKEILHLEILDNREFFKKIQKV